MRCAALVLLLALAGCAEASEQPPDPSPQAAPSPTRSSAEPTPSPTVTKAATRSPRPPRDVRPADPRWRFFTADRTRWSSPWYAGRHRLMIGYGCTDAPYYDPDPSCSGGRGFHHGIDVAIPCGIPLRAGRAATVLDHGRLGPAYGANPVLLRVAGRDVVIGHTVKVFVNPGDRLVPGQVFARVGDSGAPDGCHLHFEVRAAGGGVSAAVDPAPLLALRR